MPAARIVYLFIACIFLADFSYAMEDQHRWITPKTIGAASIILATTGGIIYAFKKSKRQLNQQKQTVSVCKAKGVLMDSDIERHFYNAHETDWAQLLIENKNACLAEINDICDTKWTKFNTYGNYQALYSLLNLIGDCSTTKINNEILLLNGRNIHHKSWTYKEFNNMSAAAKIIFKHQLAWEQKAAQKFRELQLFQPIDIENIVIDYLQVMNHVQSDNQKIIKPKFVA